MAEMHPMLWSRVIERRLQHKKGKVVNLTTYRNRTSDAADTEIIFKPQTDLAIWNYIAREIVTRDVVDHDFVDQHCVFATGPRDIGFGMRDNDDYAYAAEKDTQERERVVVLTRE
jgi:nitrate reductase NapA